VIGGDAQMGHFRLDKLQDGMQHARDCGEGLIVPLVEAALAVEVAEELVGAVDEVDDHGKSRVGHG
jgi:hypothetical protein